MGSTLLSFLILVLMATGVASDLAKDRELCADQLIGLAACLPYASGDAKTPTLDCCSGLKTLLRKGKICLCLLVKDRDDPNLGLKINASLALNLPESCHAPANVSECPGMLHLAPNSTEAKIFYQAESKSNTNGSHAISPISSTSTSSSSTLSSAARATGDSRKMGNWASMKIGWCFAATMLSFI